METLQAIDRIKLMPAIMGARYVGEPACEASQKGAMSNKCFGTVVRKAPAPGKRG